MSDALKIKVMRSQLGRARGMGSAKSGTHHWWVERATAVALIPLTFWFVYAVIRLAGQPQPFVQHWVSHPVNTVLLLALVAMTFHHMQLGLQVVMEDYIENKKAQIRRHPPEQSGRRFPGSALRRVDPADGVHGLSAIIEVSPP